MTISRIDAANENVENLNIFYFFQKHFIYQINIGELCGTNNGQHVYINLPENKAERRGWTSQITFEFMGMEPYRYNIMVTQVNKKMENTWNVQR